MKNPEELFKELVLDKIDINNPVMDNQRYPWFVFWFDINGRYICDWNSQTGSFHFNYGNVWNVFERELNLNNYEVQKIMRVKVEEHFGLGGVTPGLQFSIPGDAVEEHFGLGGVTAMSGSL